MATTVIDVYTWLEEVKDPEIPVLSLVDLGVITEVTIDGSRVRIEIKAWTSDRISEKGKTALKEFGLAPPPPSMIFTQLDILESAQCPRCDGTNTELKTPFGATLCRAIYYCHDCKDAFEQFKPL